MSESNSSSPRMASCKCLGVIRFTFKSLLALPANSNTCNNDDQFYLCCIVGEHKLPPWFEAFGSFVTRSTFRLQFCCKEMHKLPPPPRSFSEYFASWEFCCKFWVLILPHLPLLFVGQAQFFFFFPPPCSREKLHQILFLKIITADFPAICKLQQLLARKVASTAADTNALFLGYTLDSTKKFRFTTE